MEAVWGWVLEVPSGLGFTCKEGGSIGPSEKFACTVVPDRHMECDASSAGVVCYKTATPDTTFTPTDGLCINLGHPPNRADNDSAIKWSSVPTCTNSTNRDVANHVPMIPAVGAGFVVNFFCVLCAAFPW